MRVVGTNFSRNVPAASTTFLRGELHRTDVAMLHLVLLLTSGEPVTRVGQARGLHRIGVVIPIHGRL